MRLLNLRKEEIYYRDDIREFGSMSPVKKMAHQGLRLQPISTIKAVSEFESKEGQREEEQIPEKLEESTIEMRVNIQGAKDRN